MKHKHFDVIVAWAEGKQIQHFQMYSQNALIGQQRNLRSDDESCDYN